MAVASFGTADDGGLLWPPSDRRNVSAPPKRCRFAKKGRSVAILFLHDTKTARRNFLTNEKVLITEKSGLACLRTLCHKRRPDEKLVDFSPAAFRSLWKEVVVHLGLESFNYLPYSLRRGGATSAYVQGMKFDQLLAKGRWQHVATARIYLDQACPRFSTSSCP